MYEYDTSDIVKILVTASELSLQELTFYIQSFLIENKANWVEQNFNYVYQTSFENDSFSELQKYCTDLISKKPDKLFKSLNFYSISEKLLVSLIQNDNLQMSEIQVWEHVLKWGLAQNSELPSDPTSFSKEDFNSLKNTLQQCIPFIKFRNITSKEFFGKVLPYKKVLPKELYKNLLKYFLDHDYNNPDKNSETRINSKSIDSKIITFQHAELISKWVDRLEIMDEIKNSYDFKLMLRGSRDGFTGKKFHEICDNQSQTILIIKVKDSNEILGGYNPVEWNSAVNGSFIYKATKDSFIFSFKSNYGIENHILSRVKVVGRKTLYNNYFGPSFDLDLATCGCKSYCRKSSYEKPIRETEDYFSVEDYEIFQIIKS